MGVRFELEAYGDKLVARELTRFSAHAADASPAFRVIGDQFMRQEKRRFQTKGNGTWPDIADSTKARKASSRNATVRANANKILIATERLKKSLTVKGAPDQVLITEPSFMVFGTSVEYAQFHQNAKGVPMRKPLGFTETGKRDALRTLQRFIVTGDPGGSHSSTRSRGV